jgi:hypothetical protein
VRDRTGTIQIAQACDETSPAADLDDGELGVERRERFFKPSHVIFDLLAKRAGHLVAVDNGGFSGQALQCDVGSTGLARGMWQRRPGPGRWQAVGMLSSGGLRVVTSNVRLE